MTSPTARALGTSSAHRLTAARGLENDTALPRVFDGAGLPTPEAMLAEAGIQMTVVDVALLAWKIRTPDVRTVDAVFYSAHPDDECMYGGGTMCRLTEAGCSADLVVLSHGEGGRLVEQTADGPVEDRGRARSEVVTIRDVEAKRAAKYAGVGLDYLFDGSANLDFAYTTSPKATFDVWSDAVESGVATIVARLVDDIRRRRPSLIVTLDVRDDPGGSAHAHHRAFGALVQIAARLAADSRVGGRAPHVVEEVATYAPVDEAHDIEVGVDPEQRRRLLEAHASQFTDAERNTELATRSKEHFVSARRFAPTPSRLWSVLGSF